MIHLIGRSSSWLLLAVCPMFVQAQVVSLSLIDASADQVVSDQDPLIDGAVLDLAVVPAALSIRANVTGSPGSVAFELTGEQSHNQTENVAPYALFGDSNGNYAPWQPSAGNYQLTATSWSGANGTGTPGPGHSISFEVVADSGPPPPPDGNGAVVVSGQLERWHKVTLTQAGPGATELSSPNPFTDFRFQVRFEAPSGSVFSVPGSFAGNGEGGDSGTSWQAHLSPGETGTWNYTISMRSGSGIAVDLDETTGAALAPYDGVTGSFVVSDSTALRPDLRALGPIVNRGHHYLTDASGRPWVKSGPNVPENFLGYVGFDNTTTGNNRHAFATHEGDWRSGDPDWTSGSDPNAGRAIIGALNYIADRGVSSLYFLPMNIGGDGRDSFPTIAPQTKDRFDLSKLWQWDLVLQHANHRGILLHFVLAETESANETYHDGGTLGPERKLFYRMLHARFGYLNGSQWNLGEENDYTNAQRREFAEYLKAVDPYDRPVTHHTKSGQYNVYLPLLGEGDFDMTSFQGNASNAQMFDLMKSWREQSAAAGEPWVASFDEPQKIENDPTDQADGYPHGRRNKMWPALIGGAGGFEWYVQQDGGGHGFDQAIDDFSEMETALLWTGHALDFLDGLPLLDMRPDRDLVVASSSQAYALALPGAVYAVYAGEDSDSLELDLTAASDTELFDIRWFDPRNGTWNQGSLTTASGGAMRSLGAPPNAPNDDWGILVSLIDSDAIFADGFESASSVRWTETVD